MTRVRPLLLAALLAAVPAAAAQTLKIATMAPDGTSWMQEMRRGAEEIAERTEERVRFRFYPGGVMGNDRSVLRKIRIGQLHGGAVSGSGLAEISPDSQIYSLPFTFKSQAEVDYVRARMDAAIIEQLERAGYATLGFAETGFAYLMSNRPLRRVEDLQGQKVWVPEGDRVARTAFEAIGVSPVPLPLTDVLTGLQTGLVDTVGASPLGAIALQWHTRVRSVTDSPLTYLFGGLVVDARAFARLSGPDQATVRAVMAAVSRRMNETTRRLNEEARATLRKQGIEFVTPPPEEVSRWHEAVAGALDRLGEKGAYSMERVRTMRHHIDAYRRGAGGG